MSLEEENEQRRGRIKINVGGTIFETTVSTLTRLDNTVLSAMVSNCWRNREELFVDRDPTYFEKVLNYLRDGDIVLPSSIEARESLRREAEFYNLPDLAIMCSAGFQVGDWVQWKESGIKEYWNWFYRSELHGRKPCPNPVTCGDCKACGSQKCSCANCEARKNSTFSLTAYEWGALEREMRAIKGNVREVLSKTCCIVKWDNGWRVHLPQSALRLATSD